MGRNHLDVLKHFRAFGMAALEIGGAVIALVVGLACIDVVEKVYGVAAAKTFVIVLLAALLLWGFIDAYRKGLRNG